MKDYFKKMGLMFVILFTIIGGGVIQNDNIASAATVGQRLAQPEDGWQRFDDKDIEISYTGKEWESGSDVYAYNSYIHFSHTPISNKINFNFNGTKIRLIGTIMDKYTDAGVITIDGKSETFSQKRAKNGYTVEQALNYEKLGLTPGVHTAEITFKNGSLMFDAVDIDSTGQLLPYSESISLNKSTDSLQVGQIDDLIATTTPEGAQVNWSSSDESVATVDSNGKVTGVKEGQTTITATINDGSNISESCTVNVIPKTTDPTEPQDPTGDGTLFIELVDGNIKSYDVSSQEITNFTNWYKNRDLDDSQSPVYKFKKGDYIDYVVHDKIDWFEVR
ncbi:Ig-like domain-containing protein [Clostridium sp. YIM B02569]|uniref:Ig-like domain-containing protein n=1 Tax=Clostridium sp. YIM B02569 TaxID=2911967 RepID=UPI001EEA6B28|nr:Ig-like domain-containing protein [Clostridium sp. YIM B02569]